MKKFPRSNRTRSSMPRTVILGARRGGTVTSEPAAPGTAQTYYVASVLGGKGDLKLSVVGGIAQAPVAANGRSLEAWPYAVGPAPTLTAGYGWNGNGALSTPYAALVGVETFESYAPGAIAGSSLTAGTGWNGNTGLTTPYARTVAEDTFESYALGGISGSGLTDGTGWNGSAAVNSL